MKSQEWTSTTSSKKRAKAGSAGVTERIQGGGQPYPNGGFAEEESIQQTRKERRSLQRKKKIKSYKVRGTKLKTPLLALCLD